MAQEETLTKIVESVLGEPSLAEDPDWDTVAVLATVSPDAVDVSTWRYSDAGRGVPTQVRQTDLQLFRELQASTAGPDGERWAVCIIKVERDTGQGSVNFVYEDDAELWAVTPATLSTLVENLRPQPADFAR